MGRLALRALIAIVMVASSAVAQIPSKVGQLYEVRRSYETTSKRGDDGAGSSSGHNTIVESVIAQRDGGVELEFNYPTTVSKRERARDWQFPVRVFRSATGAFALVDEAKVEKRISDWLKKAKIDRRACSSWYFTWNAFKIECDPLSVLKTVAGFDIRVNGIHAGQLYKAEGAIQAVPLRPETLSSGETSFVAELELDPETWRRQAAESDVVVAQITGKPTTMEDAMAKRAKEQVSGTINVRFDLTGLPMQVVRRTTTTELEVRPVEGPVERRTVKEVIERKPLS